MKANLLTHLRVLCKRAALERSCRWSRAELENRQRANLAALRRFALERSPFYRRFHRGLEGRPLTELPILTKTTLMENFDDLVTDRAIRLADVESFLRQTTGADLFRGRYVALATSGSTGQRGVFLFNVAEWITALAGITRPMVWAGVKGASRKRPRSAMIASTTAWHYSSRVTTSLTSRLLPALRLDAADPLDSLVRQLNDWQPEVLAGYPSVLRQLAEEQIAGRLRIAPRRIATSAEVLTAETRQRVRQAWNVRMFDTYGATEYAPIAAECAYGSKHLFEDGAIIEIVDERGRAVRSGDTGDRLLLTIFRRYTQPLIRYEISDMVRPIAGECPCGRKFQMIESIEGRTEDVLFFPRRDQSGVFAAHPNLFHSVLETVPAAGWQVVQDDDGLLIAFVGLREASVCDRIAQSICQLLESRGAAAPPVRVRAVEELERGPTGKAPLILSRNRNRAWLANRG